jgi:acyl-CoA reductase-like NAD-dependent aldehyde dehydrogenase/nicotinamidase-related amidase
MRPLLLLVDLQHDYLASPGLQPAAGPLTRKAGTLLRGCREIGVPVAHVWTTVSRSDDRRMPHWRRDGRWLCEEGTPGHSPPPELEPNGDESVVHKTSFNAFRGGDLDRVLAANGTDLLVVAGVHLHACVRQAVLDAYERQGMVIWVAEDATASDDPVHAAITRRYLERRAARFVAVGEILGGLRAPGGPAPPEADEGIVGTMAARCRDALAPWQDTERAERAGLLERVADLLEPEADDLAHQMAEGVGKPVRYGSIEVRRTAEMLRAVARRARRSDEGGNGSAQVRRRPLGVVALVTPWNNPVYIPLGKIAPALAYGNAVLWKPAPAAHAISERLAHLLDEAGAPSGIVGLVAGGRRTAQAAMLDPAVDAATLTGSSHAGYGAQEICARRRIPLQAELGGNNAAVVWPDADLEHAARQIAEGAFAQAGQRCTANRRVVVHRACADELLERLQRATAALAWGDPRSPETNVGPMVNAAERERVADAIARAAALASPPVVPHGSVAPSVDGFDGAWYPPTIVPCDDPSHELVQQETLGPVLVVQTAGDWDQAIELVNGVREGLVAALFSSSPDLETSFLARAAAGILKINRSTADADVDVPFGGWKASGIGPPEHGSFDRDFYTRPQVVYPSPTGVS